MVGVACDEDRSSAALHGPLINIGHAMLIESKAGFIQAEPA